jgi:hypothetical protein
MNIACHLNFCFSCTSKANWPWQLPPFLDILLADVFCCQQLSAFPTPGTGHQGRCIVTNPQWCQVMVLLCNIITEEGLMNGSIGEVKKIVYKSREGPHGSNGHHEHPAYVIVNFPDCTIPEDDKLIEDMP